MNERVIHSPECLAEGMAWLGARDARLAGAYALTGPLPLRLRSDGFQALLSAIVSQQVSTASADAIWARMEGAGLTERAAMAAADDEALRGVGLSRQKARYGRALAQSEISFDALREMPTDAIVIELTAIPGIGRWTAEIYAMLALGRADVFAPADLALQEAARLIYDLPERPNERALRAMAEGWAPWRSVAARLLWSYYRIVRQREGIR